MSYKSEPDHTTQKAAGVAGAVVAAALVGAAIGVLLAPKKGSETREDLRRKMKEAKAKSSIKLQEARERTQEAADALIGKGQEVVVDAKKAAHETAKKAGDRVTEARTQVEDMADDARARARHK